MSWGQRVRLYGLEVDAQTLARDPESNQRELALLHGQISRLRREIGADADWPVALQLSDGPKVVRVVADNRWEADRLTIAWLRRHPGGGSQRQRAEYSSWAAPLLQQLQQRRAS